MATLATHLATLNRYLHDPDNRFWPQTDKIAYVNQAIQYRDLTTGQNRSLIPFTLTAADDTYTFTDLGNTRVFDVVGINLIYVGKRIVLDSLSYTELNVNFRVYTSGSYQGYPAAWCRYGLNQVIFGPSPSVAYATEWDCCQVSADLSALADADPLPYPYTEPVPYYAAYLAKLNERQYEEAQGFWEQWRLATNAAVSSRAGQVPTMYPGGTGSMR